MINHNKTFEDLVIAIQTMAYGEGKYMNDNTRDNMESIALSLFEIRDNSERIADALEGFLKAYKAQNKKPKQPKPTILERHPGTPFQDKVQAFLDKSNK